MRIYKNQTVFDAALERIRWLFNEFPNVICSVSGGKDSTVIFHLCLQVAEERGRLPLRVLFIDQEAEWDATVDQIRYMMYHPGVEPKWYQMPFRLFNATSALEHWLQCWDPEKEHLWIHPKDPVSIKENVYGIDRFAQLFSAIVRYEYPNVPTCYIAGVRCEESPTRFMGLTYSATYKWVTWGKILDRRRLHYTFYPIYDWSYTDVWKAIHDHGWRYNAIYDAQYRYGLPIKSMRVSNVHHETSIESLFYLQEVEPNTYERLTQRLAGIDMAGKLGLTDYWVKDLPFMFKSWREYRDYLLEHLVNKLVWRDRMRKMFDEFDAALGLDLGDRAFQMEIASILTHDWEGVKLGNRYRDPNNYDIRRRRREATGVTG